MTGISVSGKTKICGVIGDPIEHTMSPVMHNTTFQEMDLDYVYVPCHVRPEDLEKAIMGMRALNIRGLNVTIPHKVNVIPLLDKLDGMAEKIGAVNTIVNDEGVLTGYNTDGQGFLMALQEKGIEPQGKNFLIMGAGGASRAISLTLADAGAGRLIILNRAEELDWAYELVVKINQLYNIDAKAGELKRQYLKNALSGMDILVNTTSVGMKPNENNTPVDADLLESRLVVFDIVYNPLQTRLIREANAAGAKTISGIDMLAWQGALAYEIWTGQKAPVEPMRKEAIRQLEGNED